MEDYICPTFFYIPKQVLMALVVWSKYAKTAERGFLCSDETIKANFHGETVSFLLLMTVSILVPIMMVILVESNLRRQTNPEQYEFFGITIPAFIAVIGHYVSFFFIGFTLNLLITQIGKYTVGRYRPHFYTSCMPVFEDSTNCSHPINAGRYIDVYTCTNPELTEFELTDLRQSFPSGHASISFYSMTFVAVYLFFRRGFLRNFNSIKLSAELLFVSFALVAGLSRVGDNRHHCEYSRELAVLSN